MIVVDDASTDETRRIVEEYEKAHANLTLIRHLVNRNLGAARNTGLVAAKGDCIAFVDSDDEVAPGVITALKMMEEKGLDMVAMRVEHITEEGEITKIVSLPYGPEVVFEGTRLMTEHPFWMTAVWGYLYRRSLLERVKYPFVEGLFQEDGDYVNTHLYHSERVAYCDECSYHFHNTPGSINSCFSWQNAAGYILLGARYLALYERMNDHSSSAAQSILEGGSHYLIETFRKLMSLSSISEIRNVYNTVDTRIDRKSLLTYREPADSWNWNRWTRFCLLHRYLATLVSGFVVSTPWLQSSMKRLFRRVRAHGKITF